MGEMWVPQLARQLATLDQMLGGRLTINIISSGHPGQEARVRAALSADARVDASSCADLLDGKSIDFHGEFLDLELDPPRASARSTAAARRSTSVASPLPAKETAAARAADVFLTWPDTVASVGETVREMTELAADYDRELHYGLRSHVIVRETETEARAAADRLISRLDVDTGEAIRQRSLDTASVGVARQSALRDSADDAGYAEPHLWTGIGKARSGAGAAIVGDPDQVAAKLQEYVDVGIGAFVLSGYPHIAECDLFAELVLPQLDHGPLFDRV